MSTRWFHCGRLAVLAGAVLLSAFVARGSETAADDPGSVALEFINAHVAELLDYEGTIARVEASPSVTKRYKAMLAKLYRDALKNDPELGYGADAVIGGQDCPERFRVKRSRIAGDRARVVLIGEDPEFPMEVKVDLVRGDAGWLIDASGDLVKD